MRIEEELTENNVRMTVEEMVYHPKGHGKGSLYMSKSNFDLLMDKLYKDGIFHQVNHELTEIYYPGTDVKIKVAE